MRNFRPNPLASRRLFLRGAGVAMALPWLESLLPRTAAADPVVAPQRLVLWHMPCGVNPNDFTPAQTGTNYTLSPILQPLKAMQGDALILERIS